MLILAVVCALQAQPIDELLRALGDEAVETRQKAAHEIVSRWKTWTEADLKKLADSRSFPDAESRARAADVLAKIRVRRRHGTDFGGKIDEIASLIDRLREPQSKVRMDGFINPGGPIFHLSEPIKQLIDRGSEIEPLLLESFKDKNIRNEIALVLSRIGTQDCLSPLIQSLPETKDKLGRDGEHAYLCAVYALWQITGKELGIHHKLFEGYDPKARGAWEAWHRANKDYLHTLPTPRKTAYSWSRDRVLVDLEARIAGIPTREFRKNHPWVSYEEIRGWREGPEYEKKLRTFCLSTLVYLSWEPDAYRPRLAMRALGQVGEPQGIEALHWLSARVDPSSMSAYDLVWTLKENGDPRSIPFLRRLSARRVDKAKDPPGRAVLHLERLEKHRRELEGKRFRPSLAAFYLRCLSDPSAREPLIRRLRKTKYESFYYNQFRLAGHLDFAEIKDALREVAADAARDPRLTVGALGALARQGERGALERLSEFLSHKEPEVRLQAAQALWRLGKKDGFEVLIKILDLRPIESGTEGITRAPGTLSVGRPRTRHVEFIRTACRILGEMGDARAVEPLKKILSENLNGVSGKPSRFGGTSWMGRPDVVALARLGDDSGIPLLRASIAKGDPLGVAGGWAGAGGFAAIGERRHIPLILPLLGHRSDDKRIAAAREILILLNRVR